MSKENMNIPSDIFKAYDIRGTRDKLSPELAYQVGAALVKITGAKKVVVGRDMRENSPELAKNAIRGITEQGADVVDIGMCTTTMFNFMVIRHDDIEAGLMITASHNPAEYNGFKMAHGNAVPISGEEMKEIVLNEDFQKIGQGLVEERDIRDEYLDFVFETVQFPEKCGLRFVVDAGNGMSGIILPKLIERTGCEAVTMFMDPDGNFPNHEANPAKEETLKDLRQAVLDNRAAVGFAYDGDGDRVGLVDDQGEIVPGDMTLALLATEYLKKYPGGKVTMSPNMGWATKDAIENNGGEVVEVPVGRTKVIDKMKKEGAVLGGEVSSHFFFKEFKCLESSEYATLFILKMLVESEKKLSELVAPFRKYFNSGEINFEVGDKQQVIADLEAKYRPAAKSFSDLDGIRIEFDDWWFNIRPSNTEPLIRLRMEATSQALLDEKLAEVKELIK